MENINNNEIENVYKSIKESVKEKLEEIDDEKDKCTFNSLFTILSAINIKNNEEIIGTK